MKGPGCLTGVLQASGCSTDLWFMCSMCTRHCALKHTCTRALLQHASHPSNRCAGNMQHVAVAVTMQGDSPTTVSHHSLLSSAHHAHAASLGGVATKAARQLALQQSPAAETPAAAVVVHGALPVAAITADRQTLADITCQLEAIVAGERYHAC